jgi:hypothetical protein
MNAHTSLTRQERTEAVLCYRRMTELMHRLPAEKLVDLIRAAAGTPALAMTEPSADILDACDVFDEAHREADRAMHGGDVA